MSQCQGIFASGDYLLDEKQGYLCTTIERLRAHMVTLKEKLQEEKMLLTELKAETQYLTMQQTENTRVSEIHHSKSYQSKRSVSKSGLSPGCNETKAGDIAKSKKPVEEPKQKFDTSEYVQRLKEIDNLCKEEMARMNSVVEQMEPLKQIASDWMLETRLNEISATPATNDINPAPELATTHPYHTVPGIELDRPAYSGEVIVIPPKRPTPLIPVFLPEGKCDTQPDPSVLIQTPLIKSSKSKIELKSAKEQLKLDCLLKPAPQNNTVSATDRKGLVAKGRKLRKRKNSSSEVSLSSLEALKEKNITLIEVADNDAEKENVNKSGKRAEEDWKSAGSGKTSKSAISLESIQRAFANHHRKKHKVVKSGASDTDALSILQMATARKANTSLDMNKGEEDQRKQDKLFAYLHPSAKKIVKNWVMVGKEEKKMKSSSDEKPERSKKCILNLGRKKDAELSLCEDDVINKFLYDEEVYVYTPLFVSETEDECSSDTNSVSEN